MSSRQDEKERRRLEREKAERAAASGNQRKRLGMILGAVLLAAVALIVVLAVATGDDEGANQTAGGNATIPPFEITNAAEAARAANCELQDDLPLRGADHVEERVTYEDSPPTSGDHTPQAAEDGIYPVGGPPQVEPTVHSLEHGRINFQYKKGTPAAVVNQLETLVGEFEVKGTAGYHALLFENQTNMDATVAATAWRKSLTCPAMNDKVFDAFRAFWRTNVDKGPEFVP